MKNWTALAEASGLDIPDREMERLIEPLNALEQAFRPLVNNLPPDLEPAITYVPEEDAE